jgi:hypothetical protein
VHPARGVQALFVLAALLIGSERVNAVKAILIAVGLLILAWVVLAFFEALPQAVILGGGH